MLQIGIEASLLQSNSQQENLSGVPQKRLGQGRRGCPAHGNASNPLRTTLRQSTCHGATLANTTKHHAVGRGTYARHPRYSPEHQQAHAWVHGRRRPPGIQPDASLSHLHQAGLNWSAPVEFWRQIWDGDAMSRHLPSVISNTVRAGKLWTCMDTHNLYESLWYGHDLRVNHTHHTPTHQPRIA